MNPSTKSADQILRNLAAILADQEANPDDLIHIFGDVEANRIAVAQLLESILNRPSG